MRDSSGGVRSSQWHIADAIRGWCGVCWFVLTVWVVGPATANAQQVGDSTERLPGVVSASPLDTANGWPHLPDQQACSVAKSSAAIWTSTVGFSSPADSSTPTIVPLNCDEFDAPPAGRRSIFDTASVFIGLDGSKQPQDFGINAQFGGRAAVNWGVPLVESLGIGAQIGTAIDATADAVGVVQRIQGSSGRTQSFTTVGLFQRTDIGLSWGVAYDLLAENYYDSFTLGQWRLNIGYQISPRITIGVWSAIADRSASGHFGSIPVTLTPITQTNAYINHDWGNGIQTMFWGGLANSHGRVNAVLGDLSRTNTPFVFGSQLSIPLTDKLAIFGQGNFIMPTNSGTVDSYLGFVWYPHGGARQAGPAAFSPLQTVAAPTNFAVDLRR